MMGASIRRIIYIALLVYCAICLTNSVVVGGFDSGYFQGVLGWGCAYLYALDEK